MRSTMRCVLVGAILIFLNGCVQKSAKLQRSVVPPDKTLYETGSEYLKKSQYIKARLAFQTLISTYPDSDMAPLSYFSMADSFYEEGGTENLLQAEDQYKNFIVFYPNHPLAADAQMKIISANMKNMRSPDRDPQFSYKALREIKNFEQRFPDSDYLPIVKQFQIEVEENLARGDLGVGQFYADKGNYSGAVGRYKEILEQYKDFSGLDDVYFRLGNIWEKAKGNDQAAQYYEKIVVGYPFSKFFEEAKARLNSLGKPIPEVDTKLAASNQSRIKPDEGFSPLNPFIDFAKALGIVPPPDRYAEAKKALEEEKTKSAEALKSSGQTSDDIQIETVIRKSASGETREATTLGGNSETVPPNSADKDKDKDKNKGKDEKQN
jgi:outer membrane assembly lipoprotein YfiO